MMAFPQIILSRGGFGGSSNGQCLTNQFQFSSSFVPVPMVVAGTLSGWRVQTSVLGEDITLTVEKNGGSTALALTFLAGDTVKSDSDSVAFAAGDTFEIQRTSNPGGTAFSRIDWTPDDGETQLYAFTCPEFVSGRYIGVLGTTAGEESATESSLSSLVGEDGTITAIRVKVSSDPGSGKSRIFTIYKNGVAQDGSGGTVDTRATNAAGTTTASATFSLPVEAGDRISLGFTATGGATNPDMSGSLGFVADTGVVMYGGATTEILSTTSGTSFIKPYPSNADTSSGTESAHEFIGADGLIITGMRVYLTTAPGGSGSRTFTLRLNGADTAITITLSGTDQAGVITGESIPIGYGDEWCLEETRTGTPVGSNFKFVFTTGSVGSRGNFLTGSTHTAISALWSAIFGQGGTIARGARNVLFALCGGSPGPSIEDEDGVFKVCAKKIILDYTDSFTVNDADYGSGGGSGGGSPSVESLDDLSDVVLTAPTVGQVLTYDGSTWVNDDPTAGGGSGGGSPVVESLDDLSDVVISSPSNGQVLKYNGTNWVNDTVAGGGINAYYPSFTTPVSGDFAWINQGGASVTVNANGGIFLLAPGSSAGGSRIRKKAAPATPYTITAALLPAMMGQSLSPFCGIGFRQSSDGKLHLAFLQWDQSAPQLYSGKFTNATTFSASYETRQWPAVGNGLLWFRITDNGTNRILSFSADGYNFIQYTSVSRTDFLTADEVCWFAGTNNTNFAAGATLLSWAQT